MAGSFSDYLENKLLDHVFMNTAFTQPSNLYVALFTVAPSDSGGGTEVSGGSYARVSTASGDWSTASGGSLSNSVKITFPTATADWGTVVAFGVFDASTGGNMISWGDLTSSKAVNNGDTAEFDIGDLVQTLD